GQPLCPRRDPAEHRPGERALALAIQPRMEVIGQEGELEPGLLGTDGVADEVEWSVLLAREGIPEARVSGHAPTLRGEEHRPGHSIGGTADGRLASLRSWPCV